MAEATAIKTPEAPVIGELNTQPKADVDPLAHARMDDTKVPLRVGDSIYLNQIEFAFGDSSGKSGTAFKMQDLDLPENKGKSMAQVMEEQGLPKDNIDGKRDAFIDKVFDNSLKGELELEGLKSKDNMSDAEMGTSLLDMAFERNVKQAGGMDAYVKQLGLKEGAGAKEAKDALQKNLFDDVSRATGEPVQDIGRAYQKIREQARDDMKMQLGIRD